VRRDASDAHYVRAAKWFTAGWGVLAVLFATYASLLDNLIQAVNILGSLFYGTILGIFLVAFYVKHVRGGCAFYAALAAEAAVLACFLFTGISFLWYNVVGCAMVVSLSVLFQKLGGVPRGTAPASDVLSPLASELS
jgi:hypothetical protein